MKNKNQKQGEKISRQLRWARNNPEKIKKHSKKYAKSNQFENVTIPSPMMIWYKKNREYRLEYQNQKRIKANL